MVSRVGGDKKGQQNRIDPVEDAVTADQPAGRSQSPRNRGGERGGQAQSARSARSGSLQLPRQSAAQMTGTSGPTASKKPEHRPKALSSRYPRVSKRTTAGMGEIDTVTVEGRDI